MRTFKKADVWISVILIAGSVSATLVNLDYTFLVGYLVVGSWQVISMLVHAVYPNFKCSRKRNIYHIITLLSLITIPLGSFWILLFTAPAMAIFYTWMCFIELKQMNQRPLDLLK